MTLGLLFSTLLMQANALHAQTQRLEQLLSLSADQIRELEVRADEGELVVIGSDTATEITVAATVSVKGDIDEKEFAEFLNTWMDLDLYKHGRSAELIATISAGSLITYRPRIDLIVTIPATLDLVIRDGGGNIEVTGMNSDLEITDTSGKILLQRITGRMEIEDGAGSLEINDSVGDLELHDLTGWVRLNRIDGSAYVTKTSGTIRIDGLSGDLVLEGDPNIKVETQNLGGQIRHEE